MSHKDNGLERHDADEFYCSHGDDEEKEIDLLELATKLWQRRKTLIKWSIVGAVAGLIVAFSIPREYDTSVKLAPEMGGGSKGAANGIASIAAMAGFGTGSGSSSDAVYPQLYPDVVSSVPFVTSLFNVPVTDIEGAGKYTVKTYLEEETKSPWWGVILGIPGKIIGFFKGEEEETGGKHKLDNFHLTEKESQLVEALNKRISANVDAKTMVVTINVKMQDPMVSAILADTVVNRLKEYITQYRTNKARQDMLYAEKLNTEAKENYYKAQQRYADYLDRNHGLSLRSAQTTSERLENEATLAFNLFNQTSQQLQMAKAKVQETTPVYAVVSPATVPIKPSAPRKALILVGFTFLAFVVRAAWILFGQPILAEHRQKLAAEAASESEKRKQTE